MFGVLHITTYNFQSYGTLNNEHFGYECAHGVGLALSTLLDKTHMIPLRYY